MGGGFRGEVRIFGWSFEGGGEDIRVGGEDVWVAVLGWGLGWRGYLGGRFRGEVRIFGWSF